MPDIVDDFADRVISHSIDLQRLQVGERRNVLALMEEMERDLVADLARSDPTKPIRTAYQQARTEALLKQTQGTIRTAYTKTHAQHRKLLTELAGVEANFALDVVNQRVGVSVMSVGLSRDSLRAIASDTLIDGAPSKDWWAKQAANTQDRFARTIRQGVLRGETNQKLIRRVRGSKASGYTDGIMNASRREAEALVRTSVQHVANEARIKQYQANKDVVRGIQWLATLDTRTTDICMSLDGLEWDAELNPIGHGQDFPGPTAHWNCRSTQVSVLKSWDELATGKPIKTPEGGSTNIDKLFNRELQKQGFDPDTIAAVKRGTRASMNGQVADKVTFGDWLKKRSVTQQDAMLGKGRAELWRKGTITLRDLVTQSNRPLSLKQLKERAEAGVTAKAPPGPAARVPAVLDANQKIHNLPDYAGETGMTYVNEYVETGKWPKTKPDIPAKDLAAVKAFGVRARALAVQNGKHSFAQAAGVNDGSKLLELQRTWVKGNRGSFRAGLDDVMKESTGQFELRVVKRDRLIPSQVGEDAFNESSKYIVENANKSKHFTDMTRRADLYPVELSKNGFIVDGNHRSAAATMLGDDSMLALVKVSNKGAGKITNIEQFLDDFLRIRPVKTPAPKPAPKPVRAPAPKPKPKPKPPAQKPAWSEWDDSVGLKKSLNAAEKDALGDYVGDSSIINDPLRRFAKRGDALRENERAMRDTIDGVFAKAPPINQEITVHRSISHNVVGKLKVGDAFDDVAYMSTSVSKEAADEVFGEMHSMGLASMRMEITIPKGVKALKIDQVNLFFTYQDELLLARNTKLRVTSIQGNVMKVRVEP